MKNSEAFQKRLNEVDAKLGQLTTSRSGNWSESDQKEWDSLIEERASLCSLIGVAKSLEGKELSRAEQGARNLRGEESESTPGFAKAMQEIFQGRSDGSSVKIEKRALNSTSGVTLLTESVDDDAVFAPLAGSVIERMGVEVIPVENESTKIAKVDFDAMSSISPYNETENIQIGTLSLEGLKVELSNRGVIIKVHNNLLRGLVSQRTERIVMKAIADKLQQELLYELLIGKTKGFIGLDNVVGIQTVDAANAQIGNWSKLVSAYTKILDYNGSIENISAIIPPVVFEQVQNLKDTSNQYLAPPPGLKEMKMIPCSIIKKDYGVANNRTRVYLGDFSALKVMMEGTYTLKSEHRYMEEDVTAFRVITRADMQLHIPEHIVRIENIAL